MTLSIKTRETVEQRLDSIEARLDALDGSDGSVDIAYIRNLARKVASGDKTALRVHNAIAKKNMGVERGE